MPQRKVISVEDYTYELLQDIVARRMASSISEAVKRSAANYLGIEPKSKEQLRLEATSEVLEGIKTQLGKRGA